MNEKRAEPEDGTLIGLVPLTILALVGGAATGLVGTGFRLSLEAADRLRNEIISRAHAAHGAGFLLVIALCSAAALIAAWLVRRFSTFAAGGGIAYVQAVLHDGIPPARWTLIPVKFIGGVLAIGGGLAIGREGPMAQMGASLSHLIGRAFRLPWRDARALFAAGAGAGVATAFNAPLAGAVFVLEGVVQSFDSRIAVAALAASATAISVACAILGDQGDFRVGALPDVSWEAHPLFLALGAALGLAAVAYNLALTGATAAIRRVRLPVEARAVVIGGAVGALAWACPEVVGGGDPLTQNFLGGGESLTLVAIVLCVRFLLGAISYAAGMPGGLLAPLLVLGAGGGYLFGAGSAFAFPALGVTPQSFAVVGMAAFFTGVVRSPLTGMVLVSEMTGNVTLLLPALFASAAAMLVPALLGNGPIYDTLREDLLRGMRAGPAGRAPAR